MNIEKIGATFLLQEQEPTKLVGALVSTTTERQPGWIWCTFGDDYCKRGTVTNIVLTRDVALRFAALLQVLVVQNINLRGETIRWNMDEGVRTKFSVIIDRAAGGLVYLSWEANCEGILWTQQEDQFEWGLREDRALELSHALIHAIAKVPGSNVL